MPRTASDKAKDVYTIISEKIQAQLVEGTVPWHKPWAITGGPRNLVSGKAYRGINPFILNMAGFESPYWMSFKQMSERGGHLLDNQHGEIITFWKFQREQKNTSGDITQKGYALLRFYRVFNTDQMTGINVPEVVSNDNAPIDACQAVVDGYLENGPVLKFQGDQAYYSGLGDYIVMPAVDSFDNSEAFYASLFHEMGHSTGHKSRFNREGIADFDHFGSGQYAKEELVAEMTAAMLCGITGISDSTLDNSAAYIASWLKKFREDNRLVVQAAAAAQKAADMIQGITWGEVDSTDEA